jgi:hypothetical protein
MTKLTEDDGVETWSGTDQKMFMNAFIKAQANFTVPVMNAKVKYGTTDFAYADLSACLAAVLPHLNKEGIALFQPISVEDDKISVTTTLVHESGYEITSTYVGSALGKAQDIGSAITYGRRYGLISLCSIVGEEDKDGAEAAPVKATNKKAPSGPPKADPAPAKEAATPKMSPKAEAFVTKFYTELKSCKEGPQVAELYDKYPDEFSLMGDRYPDELRQMNLAIANRSMEIMNSDLGA